MIFHLSSVRTCVSSDITSNIKVFTGAFSCSYQPREFFLAVDCSDDPDSPTAAPFGLGRDLEDWFSFRDCILAPRLKYFSEKSKDIGERGEQTFQAIEYCGYVLEDGIFFANSRWFANVDFIRGVLESLARKKSKNCRRSEVAKHP